MWLDFLVFMRSNFNRCRIVLVYPRSIDFQLKNYCSFLTEIIFHIARCLKITEKVLFNIASEASYISILNGQKLIKNAKNGPF